MADQATMKGNGPVSATDRGSAAPPSSGVGTARGGDNGPVPGDTVTNAAEFAEALLTLAELQSRLAAIELKQNVQAIKVGTAFIIGGGAIAVAALPVALAGVAELLVSFLAMNRGVALLAVAVVACGVAATGAAIAAVRLRAADFGFPLTREESARNRKWVRSVIRRSARAARARPNR